MHTHHSRIGTRTRRGWLWVEYLSYCASQTDSQRFIEHKHYVIWRPYPSLDVAGYRPVAHQIDDELICRKRRHCSQTIQTIRLNMVRKIQWRRWALCCAVLMFGGPLEISPASAIADAFDWQSFVPSSRFSFGSMDILMIPNRSEAVVLNFQKFIIKYNTMQ